MASPDARRSEQAGVGGLALDGGEVGAFEVEEEAFGDESIAAAVAAEPAAGLEDAMARHDDPDGVRRHGGADGTTRLGVADALGERAVGDDLAVGHERE